MRQSLSVSPSAEKNAFYLSCLDRCLRGILDTLGEESLDAILLIGAPARGEATVVRTPAGLYSLSDIDLVCVPAAGERRDLKRKLGDWLPRANRDLRDACAGVDVSLRTREELSSLPPIIANYEMAASPALAWGDETILANLRKIDIKRVPRAESLVLIHNRIVEELLRSRRLRRAEADHRAVLSAIYGTTKLALDGVTAFLYLERDVPEGYEARVGTFLGTSLAKRENRVLAECLEGYAAELPLLARFKATGELDDLMAGLPRGACEPTTGDLANGLWRRQVSYTETLWRAVLGRVIGVDVLTADLEDVVRLYDRIESLPRSVARALREIRPGARAAGVFSPGRVLARCLFASPRELAYLVAVVAYLSHSDRVSKDWALSAIGRYCPFRLPRGFRDGAPEGRLAALLDGLELFHQAVLLGRRPETEA